MSKNFPMIESVEQAYKYIAQQIIAFIDGRPWDESGAVYKVRRKSVGASWWRTIDGIKDKRGTSFPSKNISDLAYDAVFFIRDDILEKTGQRIWELTFTLEPTGKFKIDYDYTKPEGYEETDEVITGDEINQSLRDLTQKKDDSASS